MVVKTVEDIRRARDRGLLEADYLNYVGVYFRQLAESLGDGEGPERFNLEAHGPIVILEAATT